MQDTFLVAGGPQEDEHGTRATRKEGKEKKEGKEESAQASRPALMRGPVNLAMRLERYL